MLTPLPVPEAIQYIRKALHQECGAVLENTVLVYAAQSALETGRWQSMHGWNFGNLRGSYLGQSQIIRGADEIIDGKRVTGAAVEAGFRAYPSPSEGARDFVRFLAVDTTPNNGRPNRYRKAHDAALRGDPEGFARALGAAGYYTASVDKYARAVVQIFDEFVKDEEREAVRALRDAAERWMALWR